MSDLISRSALQTRVIRKESEVAAERYTEGFNDAILRVKSMIHSAPGIDAVPVVHARWIYTGEVDEDGNCEANCSHCGAGDKHRADLKDAVPYCWKCGARMDGEADA